MGIEHSVLYKLYLKSPEWIERKEQRLEIDKHACQMCKSKDKLEVHHKTYERLGKEDIENDLITLCKSCHGLAGEEAGFIDIDECEFTFLHSDENKYVKPMTWAEACKDLIIDQDYRLPRGVFVECGGRSIGDCGCQMWAYRRKATLDRWRLITFAQFKALLMKGADCFKGEVAAQQGFISVDEDSPLNFTDEFKYLARHLSREPEQWRKARTKWLEHERGEMPPAIIPKW